MEAEGAADTLDDGGELKVDVAYPFLLDAYHDYKQDRLTTDELIGIIRLVERLRGAGFNAFTESVNTDKGTLTRVRVGPAMNRAEADQLKASVQAKLGIAGIVRPHP